VRERKTATMISFFEHDTAGKAGNRKRGLSPLHQVPEGRDVRIRELSATPELTCRLREIGLCEGQVVRLISRRSNIICQVCNSRLALNSQLAGMILVEALSE
jgi:Fe2+ transport system protein FeoA